MMNDTVREELQVKVSNGRVATAVARAPMLAQQSLPQPAPAVQPAQPRNRSTSNLSSQKTSKTLIAFQNKNASLPDWRMQLHNAVQQRKGTTPAVVEAPLPKVVDDSLTVKAAPAARSSDIPADPRVANAMRRINESRETFHQPLPHTPRPGHVRSFNVVPPGNNTAPARTEAIAAEKPILVPAPLAVPKRDTNKLPQLDVSSEPGPVAIDPTKETSTNNAKSGPLARISSQLDRIHIDSARHDASEREATETDINDIEDLAPFSMRFGAGLFDSIISGFATMVLFLPLAFTTGNWFTSTGLLTFGAAFGLISFVYLTAGLAFYGKTVGMRLFQLELVDAIENEYPTLRQAAVNSAVFLLSLALAGTGFLTAFFNEERRALHDLMSGTILVREF